jgi:hypothetical protein
LDVGVFGAFKWQCSTVTLDGVNMAGGKEEEEEAEREADEDSRVQRTDA